MKKLVLLIGIVAAGFAIFYLRPKPKPAEIRVAFQPISQTWPHYIAEELGYYKDAGLIVKAAQIDTSNQLVQDLIAGHVDVGFNFSVVPLLAQVARGAEPPVVFNSNLTTPKQWIDAIVVRADSPIRELSDLGGKKVGVFPGTTAQRMLLAVFKEQFPNLQPPIPVAIAPPLQLGELANGGIDALHAYEPNLAIGVTKNGYRVVGGSIFALFADPNPMGVGAFNRRWAKENPDAAKAFLGAYDKAAQLISVDRKRAVEILNKRTKLDPEVAHALRYVVPTKAESFPQGSFQRFSDKLHTLGEIEKSVDTSSILRGD